MALGPVLLAIAGWLALMLGRRWWLLSVVLALAGLHYSRAAWQGRVAADEDPPAPPRLRQRILRSRAFAWLNARWRPPPA